MKISSLIPLMLFAGPTSTSAKAYVRGSNGKELEMISHGRNLRVLEEKCTAAVAVVDYENSSDETFLACETPSGKTYTIPAVDSNWINSKMKNGQLKSGKTILNMPGAQVDEATGEIITRTPPGLLNNNNNNKDRDLRELATLGSRSVMIVRVIAGDGTTGFSESQLSDSVFNDPVCLASQYDACSQGKLTFVKGASNGVTTVTVSTLTSEGDGAMRNAITAALNAQFSVSSPSQLADHVMYCLPAGTMSGIAYAYINSWNSVYSNQWCTYVSGQMHEIGHNLGLAHSNEAGTYKGQTGMMGYSYSNNDGPSMCFNGAKLWQLGWFTGADDALEFNEGDLPVTLNLEGFVHSNNGSVDGKTKVVKINRSTNSDLYMVFNWQSLHNSGTREAGNQVTVVEQAGEGNGYAESELLAKLSASGVYTYNDYFGSGKYVTVTVNTISTADGTAGVTISSVPVPTAEPTTAAPTTAAPTTAAPTTAAPTTAAPTPEPTTAAPTTAAPTTAAPTTAAPTTAAPTTAAPTTAAPTTAAPTTAAPTPEPTTAAPTTAAPTTAAPTTAAPTTAAPTTAAPTTAAPTTAAPTTAAPTPPPTPECSTDAECDDGVFCNGEETCSAEGVCIGGGGDPCLGQTAFCGGSMTCNEGTDSCDEVGDGEDGICQPQSGETCLLCPGDCLDIFSTGGAVCGNGMCEQGENCFTCPSDCNGVQSGKPSGRYCCAGGPGNGCSDGRCYESGNTCTIDPAQPQDKETCCGDDVCEGNETAESCPFDCQGSPPDPCGNNICDAGETNDSCPIDCPCNNDGTCDSGENFANCPQDCPMPSMCNDGKCDPGEDCLTCPGDCDGQLNGNKNNRFCCVGSQADVSSVEYGIFCGV